MLRFFSKIRYKFAAENRPVKYLRYAIGEILLVVIGILIALQINNWNQARILKKQEKILLAEIHAEFKHNKTELESNLSGYSMVQNSLKKIRELFPIDIQTVNFDSLASYLAHTHFVGNYDYSNTGLQKMKMASSYDVISNEELRNLLLEWEVVLADYLEREKSTINHLEERYAPILGNHFTRPYWKGLRDPRANLEFLTTIEFENLIDSRTRRINYLFAVVKRRILKHNINEIMDRIIELSGEDLKEMSEDSTMTESTK